MEKFQAENGSESVERNNWSLGRVDVAERAKDRLKFDTVNQETAGYLEDLHDALKLAGADEAAKEALDLFVHLSSESSAGDVKAAVDGILINRVIGLSRLVDKDPAAAEEMRYLADLQTRRSKFAREAGKSLDDRTNFVG